MLWEGATSSSAAMETLVTAITSLEGAVEKREPLSQSTYQNTLSQSTCKSLGSGRSEGSNSGGEEGGSHESSSGRSSVEEHGTGRARSKGTKRQCPAAGGGNTVKDLKQQCRTAGLAVSGTKQELENRLISIQNASLTTSQSEGRTFRMGGLPLHAGTLRQGSLRVIACTSADAGAGAEAELRPLSSPSRSWTLPAGRVLAQVLPGAAPFGVSVLRHDKVFNTEPEHLALDPAPKCPCCDDPAEVFDVHRTVVAPVEDQHGIESTQSTQASTDDDAAAANPLHAHLAQVGLVDGLLPPVYLRVCRKGCLTYESALKPDHE